MSKFSRIGIVICVGALLFQLAMQSQMTKTRDDISNKWMELATKQGHIIQFYEDLTRGQSQCLEAVADQSLPQLHACQERMAYLAKQKPETYVKDGK